MFFLLPKVALVLLVTFSVLVVWRSYRQRRGHPGPTSLGPRIGRWLGRRSGRRNARYR